MALCLDLAPNHLRRVLGSYINLPPCLFSYDNNFAQWNPISLLALCSLLEPSPFKHRLLTNSSTAVGEKGGCIPLPFGEGGFEAFEAFEAEGSKGGGGEGGGGAEVRTKASKPSKGEDEGFEGFEGRGRRGFEGFEGEEEGGFEGFEGEDEGGGALEGFEAFRASKASKGEDEGGGGLRRLRRRGRRGL